MPVYAASPVPHVAKQSVKVGLRNAEWTKHKGDSGKTPSTRTLDGPTRTSALHFAVFSLRSLRRDVPVLRRRLKDLILCST